MRENAERRIFFSESLQGDRHFFLIQLCLRLNGHGNNWIRERGRLQKDRVILITERIARGDVLNTHDCGDIAGITRFNIFALVRLNLDQTRDACALVRARVINCIAFAQRP